MTMANDEDRMIRNVIWGVIGIVVFIILLNVIFGSWFSVKAGHRGVLMTMGKVEPQSFGEGFHLKYPFVQNVVVMSVQTQKHQIEASAVANNLQDVITILALNYHIQKDNAWQVYQDIGEGYTETVIDPTIQEAVKSVTAQFTAQDMIQKRPEVAQKIEEILVERLNPRGIIVEQVNIINFKFSDQYSKAIEDKATAKEIKLRAETDLETARLVRDQQIAKAQGEAEAMRIKSDALRQNSQLIQMTMAERWNGALPTIMMGSSGATPLFDMSGFLQQSYTVNKTA
jgi:prohibitin 2